MEFPRNFVCQTAEYSTYQRPVASPIFRKSFVLESVPEQAQVLICGIGFYRLWVNGKEITKGYLAPYISNPDHIIYYDSYEIAKELHMGENVIGVMLGSGMCNPMSYIWNFWRAVFTSAPKLALEVTLNGSSLFTAEDMLCSTCEITFENMRSGVFCDARLAQKGWNAPGFDDSGWHRPLKAENPRGQAKLCEAEPIVAIKEIAPVRVFAGEYDTEPMNAEATENLRKNGNYLFEGPCPREGGYIYDFGVNTSGVYRLRIRGQKGQKITLNYTEYLDENGKANAGNINHFYPDGFCQRDIYICAGDGEEVYTPPFTYHGGRYIYVHGITPEQATPELLTYIELSSDLEQRGDFICSDEVANTLWEMAHRSDRSNFYYFPNDCPHREKNGWTGDAQLSSEHMTLTMATENSYREWLHNIRCAMRPDGQLPGIIPTDDWGYAWGNGPAWDIVLFNLPYVLYRYRGDRQVIAENAHAMLRYLQYAAAKRDERGLVAYGLGDWLQVGRGGEAFTAPLELTCSVLVYTMCKRAKIMFEAVDLRAEAVYADFLAQEFYTAIRRELIDFSTMTVAGRCQTAQAMCIYYDIFTPGEKTQAFAVLRKLIAEKGNNFDCGIIGLRILFHVLSDFGETALAYRMITKKEYPSYGCWIDRGETTLLESFQPNNDCGSHNHHMFGDIMNWFVSKVVGIRVNPLLNDPTFVRVTPHIIEALSFAQAYYDTVAGRVTVRWEKTGEREAVLKITCAPGVRCKVELADGWYEAQTSRTYYDVTGEDVHTLHFLA